MKASGDPVIVRSGDLLDELTAETRSRGEDQKPTTEVLRHGGRSGDWGTACDRIGGAANSFYDVKIGHTVYICHPERVGAYATASRRTPTKIIPELAASGSSYQTLKDLLARLTRAMRILRAVLGEIFDESAYDRFLLRTHAARSVASYRSFISERDAAMMKKPRCC